MSTGLPGRKARLKEIKLFGWTLRQASPWGEVLKTWIHKQEYMRTPHSTIHHSHLYVAVLLPNGRLIEGRASSFEFQTEATCPSGSTST